MAAHNDIITRIKDLVGEEVTDITSYKDLINAGFNYIADLIPGDSEIWRNGELDSSLSTSFEDIGNYKVIIVTREDSDVTERICKEVPLDYLKRGEDASSIYFNAGNYRNPIYSFLPSGDMVIKPSGGVTRIFYYKYLTNEDITALDTGVTFNYPEMLLHLGILKASSSLLQAKVSQAVQDEEDSELLGLLNGQISTIDKSIQEELQRLGLPSHLVGDGNDIE